MKTTFGRTFFTFIVILLAALLMVGVSFQALVRNYLVDRAVESLKADSAAISRVASVYYRAGAMSNRDVLNILSVVSDISGSDTVICDQKGKLLICSDAPQGCAHQGLTITGEAYLQSILSQEYVVSNGIIEGLYEDSRYVVSTTIRDTSGKVLGIVIVSTPMAPTQAVMDRISDTYLFVSLLVSGDRDSALLTRLRVTPAGPMEFHLGYTLPPVLLGLVQSLLTMGAVWVMALADGTPLSLADCLLVILCTLPLMLFCIGFGILLGTLLSVKAAPGVASAILSAAAFLGGCWMDISLLGDKFAAVCTALPWFPAVRMGRAILGTGTWLWQDLAVTAAWALLVHAAACLLRRKQFCAK